MLSLVIMVRSMFATVVVVVLLAASCRCTLFYWMHLEPRQQFDEVVFDTPSWCGGFTTTPPTEDDVHDEAVVLVGCVSVAVEALFFR